MYAASNLSLRLHNPKAYKLYSYTICQYGVSYKGERNIFSGMFFDETSFAYFSLRESFFACNILDFKRKYRRLDVAWVKNLVGHKRSIEKRVVV